MFLKLRKAFHTLPKIQETGVNKVWFHDSQPNCFSKIVTQDSIKKIFIVSKKQIAPGDEITFDYMFEEEKEHKIPCHCGSRRCRGTSN